MATHSNSLAWKVPWTEEPGGLQSMRSQELDMTEATWHTHAGTTLAMLLSLKWGLGVLICALCMHAQLLQLCPTLWDPMYSSLLGSSVHGILRARKLECFAISSSRASSRSRD